MTTSERNAIEGIAHNPNGVRPAAIRLSETTDDASHNYRTIDEPTHVAQDGERVETFVLASCSDADYVKFAHGEVNSRGWKTRRYIADDEVPLAALAGHLADVTEVAA